MEGNQRRCRLAAASGDPTAVWTVSEMIVYGDMG